MSYELTAQEFHTLRRNTKSDALICEKNESLDGETIYYDWYSQNGDLRYKQVSPSDGEDRYYVFSELTEEETQEPAPQLRIRVETFEELQEILNNYAKLRKEQENGD